MKNYTLITLLLSLITLTSWGQCSTFETQSTTSPNNTNNHYIYTCDTTNILLSQGLTITGGAAPYTFLWQNTTGQTLNNATSFNATLSGIPTNPISVIHLRVTDANGCISWDSVFVQQDSNCVPCNVDASFNAVMSNTDSLTYTFNLLDSTQGCNVFWDFGDGSNAQGNYAGHVYNQGGNYNVCAYIWSCTNNCADTVCQTISVVNSNPCNITASFTANVDSSGILTLTNTASDAYFDIPALGLFTPIFIPAGTSTTINLQITGTYLVCAYASDSSTTPICSDQYCDSINFTPTSSPCNITANYNWFQVYDSLNGNFENAVYLINYSTPGSSFNYSWDFGDGTTSNLMYPSHLYVNVGTYTVCLTISDSNGCNSTYCDSIYIQTKASGFSLNVITQNAVGIEETQTTQFGEIYPNPTSENSFMTINSINNSEVTIRVIDISGKIISQKINTLISGENTIQLDTQNLTNGMYFVSITDEKGTNTNLRLIKK